MAESLRLPLEWATATWRSQEGRSADRLLLVITYVLAVVGLIMVFSASGVVAQEKHGDPAYFLKRQALWLLLGLLLLHLVSFADYHLWKTLAPYAMGATFLLLCLVLVPSLGYEGNGARRWFQVGAFSIQPAEIAKIAVILYLASFLSRKAARMQSFLGGVVPLFVVVSLFSVLILIQPDMGTAVVFFLLFLSLMYLGGVRVRHLIGLLSVLLPIGWLLVVNSEYRLKRLMSFVDPCLDRFDAGFQLCQSFFAFGSGGLWGVGIGEGKQKRLFLPEAHTDFVFSQVGEELGLVGGLLLLSLFALLVIRGFHIAGLAPDAFGRYLACGMTLLIGIQALINAGVVTGLLPTKGLTLPLVSYGGSSLVMTLVAIGMILNVSRQRVAPKAGARRGGR